MDTYYVGLATTFHDPAIAVVNPRGEVVFAEASERYLQHKRAYCCAADIRETVRVVLKKYCDPQARFVIAKPWSRRLHRFLDFMFAIGATNHERLPRRTSKMTRFLVDQNVLYAQLWLQHTAFQLSGGHFADILRDDYKNENVAFVRFPHHLAHGANACLTSPFENAACMVIDGAGEHGAISYYEYKKGILREFETVKGEESLGILYSICTALCGFSPEKGEEWKVMGLAPYGKLDGEILETLRSLLTVRDLQIKYPPIAGIKAWFQKMRQWSRKKDAPALECADLAFTAQYFYAEVMTQLLTNLHKRGISDNLALGGGCGLNSSFNGEIIKRTPFRQLHVPCSPGDDGNAIGAALLAYDQENPPTKARSRIQMPYLGSGLSQATLGHLVEFGGKSVQHFPGTIHLEAAKRLAQGKLLGWAQGRAEFGPRALGNRSILADPRPPEMKEKINARVKFREEFRPFAPSILHEFGDEYFENYQVTPYMDRTLTFRESVEEKVPAIVHINRTGRLQSVKREWNEKYYDLIKAFYDITGIPMLLNTSFNIMGKPIIHSVEDALGVFYTTGLDVLVIDDYLIEK